MNLADRVARCRKVLTVCERSSGREVTLSGAAACAAQVASCPVRFVLTDDLTRLCAELAYSRGARDLACADLLHVPAESLWIEWCQAPWQSALEEYGFPSGGDASRCGGRRGVLIRSGPDGRRGTVRTFWTLGEKEVLASSMEGYFDFDTAEGEEPEPPRGERAGSARGVRVHDGTHKHEDVLARCFRFRYERTWADYCAAAALSPAESQAVLRHVLGTVAIDVPLLLAFLLLLASRTSLPRQVRSFERLNRARHKGGRAPLLDCIEVRAPLLPEYGHGWRANPHGARRFPRLHHVRGHLVRRGSQLFWRIPHLRGSARAGAVRNRTVIWTFDEAHAQRERLSS